MARVYLSLGSNLGDRQKFLGRAIAMLGESLSSLVISSIYETNPWGDPNQPKFLNNCIIGDTNLVPEELLNIIQKIEKTLGRIPSRVWGPRKIDIDILFYDKLAVKNKHLTIPHPHLHERAFVLVPLSEIAGDFIHPSKKQSITSLLGNIDTKDVKKINASKISK